MYGGEGEIRTHATVARPNAFRVRPLIATWVLLHKPLERVRGIEPPPSAWEAEILPLNHTRKSIVNKNYYSIITNFWVEKIISSQKNWSSEKKLQLKLFLLLRFNGEKCHNSRNDTETAHDDKNPMVRILH